MKYIKTISLAIIAAISLSLSSCIDDDAPNVGESTVVTFATLKSYTASTCIFTFQQADDSPEITIAANQGLNASFVPGNRYIIAYSTDAENPFTSGIVTLQNVSEVFNGKVTEADEQKIADVTKLDVHMAEPTRSGHWLNVILEAPQTNSSGAVTFGLYVDPATLGDAYPQIYIGFDLSTYGPGTSATYYGSFDMAGVWDLSTARGVRVHYKNQQGKDAVYRFDKSNIDLKPAE